MNKFGKTMLALTLAAVTVAGTAECVCDRSDGAGG